MTALALAWFLLAATPETQVTAAKELVQQGQKLFDQGRFLEAIEKFEAAQALKPHPGLFYNLARCHEEVGHTARALRAYREYVRYMPKAEDRPAVDKAMAALQKKLAEGKVQQLRVIAAPSTANITVDGAPAGPSPAYVEVTPGPHTVSVTAPGHARQEREVNVSLDALPEVMLELVPVRDEPPPSPPLVDAPPPAPSLVPATEPEPKPEPLAVQQPPPAKEGKRLFTWVALVSGVVAGGSGIGFGVAANSASDELRRRPHATAEADQLVAQTRSFSTVANVAWGVAGAAAVATVILFFAEGAAR